jgi:hypothetical protein
LRQKSAAAMVAIGFVIAATVAIYLLRLNRAAGLMVDDAWYMLLAKAIADGNGYRLVSSATTPILPLYPPGFPAILSLVFRASPEFPQNVWLLKSVSIVAMMGVGLLTYVYVGTHRHAPRDISACAAVAVTILPSFVFLATSTVMSECVFTLVQLATIVVIHRSVEATDPRRARMFAALAAILASASVLIRSAAVGLIAAVLVWLLKERRWKGAALFVGVLVLCLVPWFVYARAHRPSAEQRAAHGGAIVYTYGDQFWMQWAGSPGFGRITARDLPARIRTNLIDVFARDVGGIVVPTFFRGASESGEEVVGLGGTAGLSAASMGGAGATMVISLVLSAIALVGFIRMARQKLTAAEFLVPVALAIVLLWPFWCFRFVLPLAPFLLFYFSAGMQAITRSWRVARIALLCIIGLNVYDHVGYILHLRDQGRPSSTEWVGSSQEVDAALDWVARNLRSDGMIATTNPALVYLRTGRKSIAYDDPAIDLATWRARGVRYLICLLPLDLPARSSSQYRVLYQSPGRLWVIEL